MAACEHCITACLREDDVKAMAACIRLNRSCADLCALAAREMARNSEFATEVCALCSEICRRCAAECDKHFMSHCQDCSRACEQCAEECGEMAA